MFKQIRHKQLKNLYADVGDQKKNLGYELRKNSSSFVCTVKIEEYEKNENNFSHNNS